MSYPFGMPSFSTMPTMNYDMYNFNNLYQMMGLWASQSKANAELWSKYMNLFPQPSAQSARQQNTAPQSQERPAAQQSQTPAASQATEQAAQPRQQIQQQPAQTQSQQQQQAQQPELDADDGKIGWKRKLKNFGKGMLNMAKGLFCDEKGFSLKRTLTTVAVAGAAAALTVATGGAAAPFLVAAGAAMGAFQTAKGAYKAATAKTDAEAEAAWQDIGAGTLSIGLSAAGAKGALKAAGKPVPASKGLTGSVKATADSFSVVKDGVKTLATNPKETLAPLVKAETWTNAGTKVANAAKETFSVKSAPKTTKEALGKAYDKDTAKLNKKANKLAKEISELKAKPETEALKLEIKQKTARLEKIYRDINRIKAEKAKIGAAPEESGLQATNRQNRHVNPQKAAAEASSGGSGKDAWSSSSKSSGGSSFSSMMSKTGLILPGVNLTCKSSGTASSSNSASGDGTSSASATINGDGFSATCSTSADANASSNGQSSASSSCVISNSEARMLTKDGDSFEEADKCGGMFIPKGWEAVIGKAGCIDSNSRIKLPTAGNESNPWQMAIDIFKGKDVCKPKGHVTDQFEKQILTKWRDIFKKEDEKSK